MNTEYTLNDYFKEINAALEANEKPVKLSKECCQTFLDRLDFQMANDHGYYDDEEDYHSWGYALLDDIDHNAENEVRQLDIFNQIEMYGL